MFGFSTNLATSRADSESSIRSPVFMYPKPTDGSVGVIPMVTIFPVAATSMASRTVFSNLAPSTMTWSAANEPTITSGWRFAKIAAASAMAAVESLGDFSRKRFAETRSSSWSLTACWCASPVTTTIRSGGVSGSSRSQVSCKSVWPEPVRSCKNLGAAARERGQSRLPIPPAGMMLKKRSIGALIT